MAFSVSRLKKETILCKVSITQQTPSRRDSSGDLFSGGGDFFVSLANFFIHHSHNFFSDLVLVFLE